MDRLLFDDLKLQDQVNYINNQLNEELSLTKICENVGIGRTTIRDRFKKIGYTFNKESNKYRYDTNVLNGEEYKENTNIIHSKKYKENTDVIHNKSIDNIKPKGIEYSSNTNIIPKEFTKKENIEKLLSLLNYSDDIIHMLQEYHNNKNIIDVPELKINRDNFSGEVKITTVRLYQGTYENFKTFASDHKEYTMQDLVTQALFELMNKYKK